MIKIILALFLLTATAVAVQAQKFSDFITDAPALSGPLLGTDFLPVVRNRNTFNYAASGLVGPIQHKTIVGDFGATCDGVADDTAALAAAATWVNANGGIIDFPPGKTCQTAATILVTGDSAGFTCSVSAEVIGGFTGMPVSGSKGCELKWTGAAGGRMMSFASPTGAVSIVGASVTGLRFNGNNGLAGDGLHLSGLYGGAFRDLRFVGGFSAGSVLNLDIPQVEAPVGDQYNHFSDISIFNTGFTSNTIFLGFYQSLTGTPANASFNYFTNVQLFTGSGATGKGIWCLGCDNNQFSNTTMTTSGGTAIDFDIYNANGVIFGANHNIFDHVGYVGGPTVSRGTTSVPACAPFNLSTFGQCSWGNELRSMDGSNATANPTVEPGSFIKWEFDYGLNVNQVSLIAGDGLRPAQTIMESVGGVGVCGAESLSFGAHTGSFYCANNIPDLYFSNGIPGTPSRFIAGLYGAAGAEDLQFTRVIGTGRYKFDQNMYAAKSLEVGIGGACTTLGSPGSVCLNATSTNGLELTDGVGANWFIRMNPTTHNLEILRNGGAMSLTFDPTTFQLSAAGGIRPGTSTVASLPTCNAAAKGAIVAVTDQLAAPAYGGALTGGGVLTTLAMCNTAGAWEAH